MSGRFDPTPSTVGVGLTAVFAAVAALATAVTPPAAVLGVVGAVAMPLGVRRASRRTHGIGAAVLFGGVLAAGTAGAPPVLMLLSTAATIVAWDVGENAIGVGAQLGADAATSGIELAHAAASVLVAAAVAGLAYGVFALGIAGQSSGGVVLLVLAALLFALLFVD